MNSNDPTRLTPTERAEKIWCIMGPHPERKYYTPSEKKADIAAEIRQAVEFIEAHVKSGRLPSCEPNCHFYQAYRKACGKCL